MSKSLKNLQKRNKKFILFKVKVLDFLKKRLWQHILVLLSLSLCAFLFSKWIEMVCFCFAHTAIRNAFDKQLHFKDPALCMTVTVGIVWLCIPYTLPLSISLLSSIPIAFGICFLGYLLQDRIEYREKVKELEDRCIQLLRQLSLATEKDIYAMTEDELYEHCRSCGLDEEDCKIAYFIVIERLKGKELYEALPYSEATIKRRRLKIMSKIQKDKTTTSF